MIQELTPRQTATALSDQDHQAKLAGLTERVASVINSIRHDGRSLRAVGQTLGMNRETLRRMSVGQCPSAELLVRLAEEYNISAEWLLTGRGNQFRSDRAQRQIAG